MPSVFTRIIVGELPGRFVWKDAETVAFLSINPLAPGHTLVVPREEIDHWLDLPKSLRDHLMDTAHAIGTAQQRAFHPAKVGLMLAGLEVPHCHVHVVPINDVHDLDFARAEANPDPHGLDEAATTLRATLRELGYDHGAE